MWPDDSMTLGDLKLRLAVQVGAARHSGGSANEMTLPIDPARKALVESAVNDGIARFCRAHAWTFLETEWPVVLVPGGTGALNINSDACRYRLPDQVESGVLGAPNWSAPGSTLPWSDDLEVMTYSDLRAVRDQGPEWTSRPLAVAVDTTFDVGGVGDSRAKELLVWPPPDQAYTLKLRFRFSHKKLVDDAERGFWGKVHDLTVFDCALMSWNLTDRKAGSPQAFAGDVRKLASVQESIRIDNRQRPRKLGPQGNSNGRRPYATPLVGLVIDGVRQF